MLVLYGVCILCCVYVLVCGNQTSTSGTIAQTPCFLRQDLSLAHGLAISLDWLASKL